MPGNVLLCLEWFFIAFLTFCIVLLCFARRDPSAAEPIPAQLQFAYVKPSQDMDDQAVEAVTCSGCCDRGIKTNPLVCEMM